jgi:catechol 2,3-dioxygenase-like lactoylglutathione lyase family enzyme
MKGIQHCAIVVSDVEQARRFYMDVLGLDEIERPGNFRFSGAWLRAGEDEIHLIEAAHTTCPPGVPEPGVAQTSGLATHIAFEVDDLAAMEDRLAERDVAPVGGPMPRGDGVVQLFLRDPDGYLVELFERTGEDQSAAFERAPVTAQP